MERIPYIIKGLRHKKRKNPTLSRWAILYQFFQIKKLFIIVIVYDMNEQLLIYSKYCAR